MRRSAKSSLPKDLQLEAMPNLRFGLSLFAFSLLYFRYAGGPGNLAPKIFLWASFFSLWLSASLRAFNRRIATQFLVRSGERSGMSGLQQSAGPGPSTLEGSSCFSFLFIDPTKFCINPFRLRLTPRFFSTLGTSTACQGRILLSPLPNNYSSG